MKIITNVCAKIKSFFTNSCCSSKVETSKKTAVSRPVKKQGKRKSKKSSR